MLETELIPAEETGSRRLMVVLHGLGDSIEGYRWLPAALRLPGLNYLLVNAPEPYFTGFSWFDYYGDPAPGIVRNRAALMELLDAQRAAGFPTQDTVLFGFSQGCLMAFEVGCRYSHRLAGLVGISGKVYQPERLIDEWSPQAKKQRFLVTHGYIDPVIPFEPVKEQIEFLQRVGLDIEWHEFNKDHTIAGEPEVAVIREFVEKGFAAPR